MGNNNPETIVGRSLKDEDQFRLGLTNEGAGRTGETFGRILIQDRRETRKAGIRPVTSPSVEFQDAIGKELRNLYDDVAAQPVPDRFLKLLNQLETNVLQSSGSPVAPGEKE